jgi:hypothetical protein
MSTTTTTTHVHYLPADGAAVAEFSTSSEAWTFMRMCSANGVAAGYPVASTWTCTACK